MLVKLEAKSNRVKGLAFHPKRPWILSSLHNGSIQLWDYRMGTLLDRFDEHDGPVRGIDFHPMQPLFVSGGDDYKIKVWNYKMRRCLFTLLGHLDYIRTVQFHNEQPWIVSSSDDQTIRVWNWQSRSCIAVLTGHNHYVMSASFHPREDLVVSASLDQTVRVWDISGLKKKNVTSDDMLRVSQLNQDLFGGSDVMAKYVLEGHDRGVNWASFHPTQPLIVSGADDRQVKIWRMNDIRAWEVDTLRGHTNNVSCVKFHSTQDLIISNSEDKSIRVWDLNKRTLIHSFRRENDRFWVLSVHPEQNLIAAGHDTGFVIFKLERERPASVAIRDNLLYVKDKYLRRYQFSSSTDTPVVAIRRAGNTPPRTVSFNPQEGYALITTDGEGGIWELYQVPKSGTTSADIKKGAGIAAVFVGRNKFVFMDKSRAVFVRTLHEDATKRVTLPVTGVDYLFQAYPSGRMLLRTEDKVYLYDFEQKTVIGEVNAAGVKYVVWSEDNSRVALLSKHVITLTNSKLEQMCSVHESIRVKSGAFDENGVFIYTTLNHMKYCLPNGDNGTIKTLEKPLYIAKVTKNAVHILDRDGKVSINYVDATEYKFKLALLQRKYGEIKAIISKSDILGQSIIAYLQQKGYPEIAMRFVKDDSTLFNLALESGNVDVAHEAASKLENKECWLKLGAEALRQGNLPIVEKSYYKVKDFDRLSFLYLITGNSERLQKMLDNAVARKDVMSRFNNALYLGDVDHRIKVLEEVGQLGLAYVTAVTHGLTEKAEALKAKLGDNIPEVSLENTKLLTPPTPVYRELSWPLLNVSKNVGILGLLDESPSSTAASAAAAAAAADSEDVGGWVGDDIIPTEVAPGLPSEFTQGLEKQTPTETEDEVGAWSMLDDIPELADVVPTVTAATSEAFFVPTKGRSIAEQWCDASGLAADHIAAGSFQTAMQILHRTAGIVNFAPLKPFFMSLYNGSQGTSAVTPMLSPMKIPLQRTLKETNTKALPSLATCSSLSNLVERLKLAYKALTNAKFTESQQHFQYIIHALLFVVVEDRNAVAEVKELLGICREYLTGLRLEFVKKDTKDPVRATELAAYFTHTNIQAIHQMLSLGSAMAAAYRLKNLNTAASFARRLLELNPNPKMAAQAQTILQLQEKNPTDEHKLNYDERNPFVVDGISLTPIYRGSELVRCAYCYAPYSPQHKGKLCVICNVAQIGADSVGLVSSLAQLK